MLGWRVTVIRSFRWGLYKLFDRRPDACEQDEGIIGAASEGTSGERCPGPEEGQKGRQNRVPRWQWYVRGRPGGWRGLRGRFRPRSWPLALHTLRFLGGLSIGPTAPAAPSSLLHRRKSASVLRGQPIAPSYAAGPHGRAAVQETEVNHPRKSFSPAAAVPCSLFLEIGISGLSG